jgi:hypothetical protein
VGILHKDNGSIERKLRQTLGSAGYERN